MKLRRVFYKRNLMLIYLIMSVLLSLTMVDIPVKGQDEVRVYVVPEPPAYIAGEAVGDYVYADVYIDSPAAWYNDNETGIVGWAMSIKVNPDVLEPWSIYAATAGYFLYDFAENEYGELTTLLKTTDKPNGLFYEVSEFITGWESDPFYGAGAGGTGKLCRLRYKSKNETAFSLIDLGYPASVDIDTVYYYTASGKFAAHVIGDGYYNEPPPSHTLTVESTPIQGINFTIGTMNYTTNATAALEEGNYTVTMPPTLMNGTDQYNFVEWEDNSTNPVRNISLTSNMTITATYKLLVAPVNYTLTVESTPIDGINFTIGTTTYTTNHSVSLLEGSYIVNMSDPWMVGTDEYNFVKWEDDSTSPARTIFLGSNMTIIATYELYIAPVYHNLTVESMPIDGIDFMIDATTYTTNVTVELEEGNYTVTMPSTWMVGGDQYNFVEWEDNSTNPVRNINLTSNMTITVTYELVAPEEVRVYVVPELPDYISGEPVGDFVIVNVYIDSPAGWYDTTNGIVGWAMSIKVDPDVLEPWSLTAATAGYFLFDYTDTEYGELTTLLMTKNASEGLFFEVSEFIDGWESPPFNGSGAGGSGLLCQLKFKSKNETAFSLIDLGYPAEDSEFITVYYYTSVGKFEVDVVGDGYYNPPPFHTLTVESTPIQGINFTVGSAANITNWSDVLLKGPYTVTMPSTWMVGGDQYNFVEWEDNSTDPVRSISLTSDMTIIATYKLLKEYALTVNSGPITGINFTIDGITNITNWSDVLLEGTYTVTMNATWMVGGVQYNFKRWEDDSTNPARTVSLTSNMTITATYVPVYTLTVESTPIDGIDFTINAKTYTTNTAVKREEGTYTVTMPDTMLKPGPILYYFRRWEDDSISPVRNISLTSDMTIIATYGPPKEYALTVNSSPITGINFTIDSITNTTNWTGLVKEGTPIIDLLSITITVGDDIYTFDHWEDNSTLPFRDIPLKANTTVTAYYALVPPPQWTLNVNSDPITGIDFTLDGVTYATNWSDVLTVRNYTVVIPSTWTTVEGDVYNFTHWEDASTSPSRVVSLTSNMTITATYTKLVPPIASFTYSPTEPIVNETVTFDASASNDPDGTIASYAWDFGDGTTETYVKDVNLTATATHAYEAAGNYNVALTVTDNDGLTHTVTKSITVEEAPPSGIPWYLYVVAAGAAAIIMAAVVFYFLRIRKPKPT